MWISSYDVLRAENSAGEIQELVSEMLISLVQRVYIFRDTDLNIAITK